MPDEPDLEPVHTCDLCGCTALSPLPLGDLPLAQCDACGFVVQSPRPLAARHRGVLGTQDYSRVAAAGDMVHRLPYADSVERFVARGRILDVGAGDGLFVAAASKRGWTAAGVEIAASGVARYRDLGIDVRIGDFLETDERAADHSAVTFYYSLEQLPSPRAALAKAHRILLPGGVLLVEMVTLEELRRRLPDTHPFGIPGRLTFPTLPHLRELVWTSGFAIEEEIREPSARLIARRLRG